MRDPSKFLKNFSRVRDYLHRFDIGRKLKCHKQKREMCKKISSSTLGIKLVRFLLEGALKNSRVECRLHKILLYSMTVVWYKCDRKLNNELQRIPGKENSMGQLEWSPNKTAPETDDEET